MHCGWCGNGYWSFIITKVLDTSSTVFFSTVTVWHNLNQHSLKAELCISELKFLFLWIGVTLADKYLNFWFGLYYLQPIRVVRNLFQKKLQNNPQTWSIFISTVQVRHTSSFIYRTFNQISGVLACDHRQGLHFSLVLLLRF